MNEVKYCIITALYKNIVYKSIPIEIEENTEQYKFILALTTTGTSTFNMIKFPLAENEIIILSKEQINETLFTVKYISDSKVCKRAKKIKE